MRLAGAPVEIGLILAAEYGAHRHARRAAAVTVWFGPFTCTSWPALLTLAIAGYVFSVDAARGQAAARGGRMSCSPGFPKDLRPLSAASCV
jgi:hypothetical protein